MRSWSEHDSSLFETVKISSSAAFLCLGLCLGICAHNDVQD